MRPTLLTPPSSPCPSGLGQPRPLQKQTGYLPFMLAMVAFAAPAFAGEIRHAVAVVKNPVEDYLANCGWEFDVEGGGYTICVIDLNGDGMKDQMFSNAATSGTGGDAATVYLARKDGTYTRIGTLGHGAIATGTLKNGARLLHCSWRYGGGSSAITTYSLSHQGLEVINVISGDWRDEKYQKQFAAVFETPLKPEYKFVAARPKPETPGNR